MRQGECSWTQDAEHLVNQSFQSTEVSSISYPDRSLDRSDFHLRSVELEEGLPLQIQYLLVAESLGRTRLWALAVVNHTVRQNPPEPVYAAVGLCELFSLAFAVLKVAARTSLERAKHRLGIR